MRFPKIFAHPSTYPPYPRAEQAPARKMYAVVALFTAIVMGSLGVNHFCAQALDSVRAYIAGEGLWSKGQKTAFIHLLRYLSLHDEADYQAFQQAIAIPLGDRQARLELDRPEPDPGRVRAGFLGGGNHPDDIEALVSFYQRYHAIGYMRQAVAIWAEGDRHLLALLALAERLHREALDGIPPDADSLRELETLNQRLSTLEAAFSSTLGAASRWVNHLAQILTYASVALFLGLGLSLSLLIIRKVHRAERTLYDSEARFRHVVDSNMIGIVFWRRDGKILEANQAFLRMLGYDEADIHGLDGLSWQSITPEEYAGLDRDALAALTRHESFPPYEKELIGRDGDRIPVCVGAALFGHPPDQGVGFVLDMRERKRMEARLRLAARAIEDSGKAIVITDAENRVVFANRAFTEITGYAPHEVLGKNQHLFSPKTEHSLRETGRWEGEIVGRRKSGAAYPKWLSISAVKDEHGRVGHYVAIFSDITERKAMESKILHQARHDALTGLPNRLLLEEGLGCGMAEAERRHLGLAVLFLDLDGFKAVNDSFGHRVGDLLLRAVAERLRRGVRHDHDLVGRLGGDEFVVILNGIHHVREALAVAEELVDAIATPYDIEGRTLRIGTSIGISAYPQDGRSPAELLGHADSAMYQAKKQGRNTYRCYSPGPRVLN